MKRPAAWCRGRELTERTAPSSGAREEARARRWVEELGEEAFAARMAATGLTSDELPRLLADAGDDATDIAPDWWTLVTATLEPDGRRAVPDADDEQDADVMRGALRLAVPFARRVHHALRAHREGADGAALTLAQALAGEIIELAVPTIATELVLAEAVERWDEDDATRRAAEALRALNEPQQARALLEEHPGLARLIADRTRLAIEAGLELLERVAVDRPCVRDELFGGEDPGRLVAVSASGDAHDGGRRVARLQFASGMSAMLKPRPMAAEAAYEGLLEALNDAGFKPALRPPRTLRTGPHHGWQEIAQPGSCETEAEVDAYFRRFGGQLAVLHALRATDMHQENVLACGEHPAVIDLETLLHPRLGSHRASAADPLIAETGLDCVLRVGLLPRSDAALGVEMSGLGRDPDAVHLGERFVWEGVGAAARLVQEELRLEAGENAPRLSGVPVAPARHVEALAAGFRDAYELLVTHRERWLEAGGPLAAFAGIPLRFILRPTKVYVDLLRRQAHDRDGLVDGLAREEALNVLWRGASRRPELAAAAPAEHDDLWVGDVPRFAGRSGSADGAHHRHGSLPGLLGPHPAPGPEVVRRLDACDLERQLAFVRSSVLAGAAAPSAATARGVPEALGAPDHLTAARAAGQRLAVLALHDGTEAGWLSAVVRPPVAGRVLRPVDRSLRHGQLGIALLLARLHAVDADSDGRHGELARAAIRRLGPEPCPAEGGAAARVLHLAALAELGAIEPAVLRAAASDLVAAIGTTSGPMVAATAPALAIAAGVCGPDPQLVAAARAAAADAGAVHSGLVALVAHTAAACVAAGTRDEGVTRAALSAALEASHAGDDDGPTTRRLDLPVARAEAGRALGRFPGNGEEALRVSERAAAFVGGAESPVLEDGLAGIGLARLALAGDGASARVVTHAIVLRADADADAADVRGRSQVIRDRFPQ